MRSGPRRANVSPVSGIARSLLAALLAALTAAALFAASAAAAPKEVAYVCKGEDICLLDPDNPGAAVANLTDDGATSYDEDPTWSPDGKRLAFVARFPGKGEENVYTMEPEAAGNLANFAVQVTHFTNGLVPTGEIAWSPDETKIAFERGGASFGSNPLYVVNSDGSSATATKIAEAGVHPTWSPDSAKIAFSHANQVYLVNPDAGAPAMPRIRRRPPACRSLAARCSSTASPTPGHSTSSIRSVTAPPYK